MFGSAEACVTGRTRELVDTFLDSHAVGPNTLEHYKNSLLRFARAFPDAPPADTTAVESYIRAIVGAPSTRDGHFRDLRVFYRWCASRAGLVDAMDGAMRARFRAPLPDVLSDRQVRRLLQVASRRDRALIAFALDTGARLAELAGARRSDINESIVDGETRFSVRLRGSVDSRGRWHLKTGERIVPLSTPAARLLTGVGDGDLLWTAQRETRWSAAGEPLTQSGVQQLVRRCTKSALGRVYGPHVLRHTMATMYLRAGGDIHRLQRILGHSKIETTLIYVHFVTDDLTAVHDLFSPVARAVKR